MKKYYVLLILTTWLFTNAFAQAFFEQGILITNAGDTLRGLVGEERVDRLAIEVYFKPSKEGKVQRFTADDLKCFYTASNDYFEAHSIVSKNEGKYNTVKRFLHRLESGYVSLFRLKQNGNVAFYLKKEGKESVDLLFFTVKNMETPEPRPVDTLTVFDTRSLMSGQLRFGAEYIQTITKYFMDDKDYIPHYFKLMEHELLREIRAYNKKAHPQFSYPTFFKKEKGKPRFVLNVNVISAISPKSQLTTVLFGEESAFRNIQNKSAEFTTSSFTGYEISAGFYAQKRLKGMGLEVGYSRMSKVALDYKYTYVDYSIPRDPVAINYKGNFEFTRQAIFMRVNYMITMSSKISPYVSAGVSKPFIAINAIEFEQSSGSPRASSVSLTPFAIEPSLVLGMQFAFNRQHCLKTEFDFSPVKDTRTYRSLFRLGYQFSFGKK